MGQAAVAACLGKKRAFFRLRSGLGHGLCKAAATWRVENANSNICPETDCLCAQVNHAHACFSL